MARNRSGRPFARGVGGALSGTAAARGGRHRRALAGARWRAEAWQPAASNGPTVNEQHGVGMGIDIPGLPSLGGWGDDIEAARDDQSGNDVSVELGPLTPRAARAIAAAAQASNEAE